LVGVPDAVIVASVDDLPLLSVPVRVVEPERESVEDLSRTPVEAVTLAMVLNSLEGLPASRHPRESGCPRGD
jgi:hypothetical protein